MMYLLDKLPKNQSKDNFERYYDYTKSALKFIKDDIILSFYPDAHYFDTTKKGYYSQKDMLYKVDNCIKRYKMCVNIPLYEPKLQPSL
jgi:hypothetical protein